MSDENEIRERVRRETYPATDQVLADIEHLLDKLDAVRFALKEPSEVAAHARGELDAPKQQPVLYTRANGERVEDERKEDKGRFYVCHMDVRMRGTGSPIKFIATPPPIDDYSRPDVAAVIASALSAAYDRRARKPEPKQQPDWEALCRNLVGEIYETGWCIPARQWDPIYRAGWNQACADVQSSKAATAARDAVRASEPEPDERRCSMIRFLVSDDGEQIIDSKREFPPLFVGLHSMRTKYAIRDAMNTECGFQATGVDRRQRTGTIADRREGGA